jgi:hypothetical protein
MDGVLPERHEGEAFVCFRQKGDGNRVLVSLLNTAPPEVFHISSVSLGCQ